MREVKELNLGVKVAEEIISILAFADDIIIFAENEEDLQKILKCIEEWCKKWRLKVNSEKTNVVHFRKKGKSISGFEFVFDNTVLSIIDIYQYLGTVSNEHLDFTVTSSILSAAAGRALGAVISKFKGLKNVGFNTLEEIYHSSVVPIADYGSGVWGYKQFGEGDKIQFRAIRYYLGVHSKAPLLALEGDIGWISCKTRQHINMLRLWNRMINMENNRITKRVFNYDYQLCKNWSHELKDILYSVGLNQEFDSKTTCNIYTTKSIFINLRNTEWKNSLLTKPKLHTYVKFKEDIVKENYVIYCTQRRRRSLFAQFRLGILPLHLETGWFKNKKVEERICQICTSQDVENEEHFVCVCNTYSQLCYTLYLKLDNAEFHLLSNEQKLVYLVKYNWKDLSIFIEKAWEKRTEFLYK